MATRDAAHQSATATRDAAATPRDLRHRSQASPRPCYSAIARLRASAIDRVCVCVCYCAPPRLCYRPCVCLLLRASAPLLSTVCVCVCYCSPPRLCSSRSPLPPCLGTHEPARSMAVTTAARCSSTSTWICVRACVRVSVHRPLDPPPRGSLFNAASSVCVCARVWLGSAPPRLAASRCSTRRP
jgi:hypothetical protein